MFAKGMTDCQYEIYWKTLIFERMIEDIPAFIQKEVEKIKSEIDKDAESVMDGDIYVSEECDGDEYIPMNEIECHKIQVPIAYNAAKNTPQQGYIEILDEIPIYFYRAMMTMLYSYVECSLKNMAKEKERDIPSRKSKIEYAYERLAKRLAREDLGLAEEVWPDVRHFSNVRNQIVHEGRTVDARDEPTKESLQEALEHIKLLLKKTSIAIDEYNKTKTNHKNS